VSYPRSGSTWVRFLIANMARPKKEADFPFVEKYVPDGHQKFLMFDILRNRAFQRPLCAKAHFCWFPCYTKCIYLYRDVRDVAISSYYYNFHKFHGTLAEWLELFCVGKVPFGSWWYHVKTWMSESPPCRNCIKVKYEDLLQDTFAQTKRIADFIGIDISDEVINKAIERTQWKYASVQAGKQGQHPKLFGLHGESGYWKNELTPAQAKMLWNLKPGFLSKLGYRRK